MVWNGSRSDENHKSKIWFDYNMARLEIKPENKIESFIFYCLKRGFPLLKTKLLLSSLTANRNPRTCCTPARSEPFLTPLHSSPRRSRTLLSIQPLLCSLIVISPLSVPVQMPLSALFYFPSSHLPVHIFS